MFTLSTLYFITPATLTWHKVAGSVMPRKQMTFVFTHIAPPQVTSKKCSGKQCMCERGYSFLPSCLTPVIPFGAWLLTFRDGKIDWNGRDLLRSACHGRSASQAECVEIGGNKQHATVEISEAQEEVAAKRRSNEWLKYHASFSKMWTWSSPVILWVLGALGLARGCAHLLRLTVTILLIYKEKGHRTQGQVLITFGHTDQHMFNSDHIHSVLLGLLFNCYI